MLLLLLLLLLLPRSVLQAMRPVRTPTLRLPHPKGQLSPKIPTMLQSRYSLMGSHPKKTPKRAAEVTCPQLTASMKTRRRVETRTLSRRTPKKVQGKARRPSESPFRGPMKRPVWKRTGATLLVGLASLELTQLPVPIVGMVIGGPAGERAAEGLP
eukprot:Rmarinus@m.18893